MKNKKPSWLIKAYNNPEFLNSPEARSIRVLTELIEPAAKFKKNKVHNTVVFFGSARTLPKNDVLKKIKEIETKIKKSPSSRKLKAESEVAQADLLMSRYYEDAVNLSKKLTLWFKQLKKQKKYFHICSGGGPGIMEAANRGAVEAKGESVGLNISLPMEQNPNKYQTKELSSEFHYFFVRKFWFAYLAKALVIFPGGFGTLDELFELLTLIQTKKSTKKLPVVLFGTEYWNELINFDAMKKWHTIDPKDLNLFKIFDDTDKAFDYLKKHITKYHLKKK